MYPTQTARTGNATGLALTPVFLPRDRDTDNGEEALSGGCAETGKSGVVQYQNQRQGNYELANILQRLGIPRPER